MSLFKPLSASTVHALAADYADAAQPKPGVFPRISEDIGDDDLFRPSSAPAIHHGAEGDWDPRQYIKGDVDDDADYDDMLSDGDVAADLNKMDELGEWAAVGGSGAVNLTARLRPRNNANVGHTREIDRLQRAEDRRRETVARDKLDRATVEQVLDPRTRMILFRLLGRGRLHSVDGCVSTGKEANVYYGTAPGGDGGDDPDREAKPVDVAVKVFKTAILSFKDRERYVAGEFRFRRGGYNRQSNRKMVQQWAEKEYRNLTRLREAGVPAPTPLIIKPPVLVMVFFGRDGWPAPRLKDANLSTERLEAVYPEMCVLMRRMYQRAKLVHGDLSEYNILYHKRRVVIIDVSQSVEEDHPMALDFLRRDCMNINQFFARSGVSTVLGLRELFDYVTKEATSSDGTTGAGMDARAREDAEMWAEIGVALDTARDRTAAENEQVAADDVVFNQSFIPRKLGDVATGEMCARGVPEGDEETRELLASLSGVPVDEGAGADGEQAIGEGGAEICSDDGSTGAESEGDSDEDGRSWVEDDKLSPEEAKAARREHKKAVKADARVRRENKTPKHVKKRRDVVAKRRRHVKTK